MKKRPKICSSCERELNSEERAAPRVHPSGGLLCDSCWSTEFEDECFRCGNYGDKSDLQAKPGEYILVAQEAPTLGHPLVPGYYLVKEWPFFADGMIEGYFYGEALERVADLDEEGKGQADARAASGAICPAYNEQVAKLRKEVHGKA